MYYHHRRFGYPYLDKMPARQYQSLVHLYYFPGYEYKYLLTFLRAYAGGHLYAICGDADIGID